MHVAAAAAATANSPKSRLGSGGPSAFHAPGRKDGAHAAAGEGEGNLSNASRSSAATLSSQQRSASRRKLGNSSNSNSEGGGRRTRRAVNRKRKTRCYKK